MKPERPEKTLERVSLQICWIICGLFINFFKLCGCENA